MNLRELEKKQSKARCDLDEGLALQAGKVQAAKKAYGFEQTILSQPSQKELWRYAE